MMHPYLFAEYAEITKHFDLCDCSKTTEVGWSMRLALMPAAHRLT